MNIVRYKDSSYSRVQDVREEDRRVAVPEAIINGFGDITAVLYSI